MTLRLGLQTSDRSLGFDWIQEPFGPRGVEGLMFQGSGLRVQGIA